MKDALGRPLAGVRLELRNQTHHRLIAASDAKGRFHFALKQPGDYTLSAKQSGFRAARMDVMIPAPAPIELVMEARRTLTVPISEKLLAAQNGLTATGTSKYTLTAKDIQNLPAGEYTPFNGVLLQMPGVALDQNQEIHIRGEHMGIQYQINGVMLPLDVNSDPTFVQLLNAFFVNRVSLADGVLPPRYGFRTAGVIEVQTKSGCDSGSGNHFSVMGGQRDTASPSFEVAGCRGKFSYFLTGLYQHDNLGFSSATPGPDPIHDLSDQGQGFAYLTYDASPLTRFSLLAGSTIFSSQFPNRPNEPPLYMLNGVNPDTYPSTAIDSGLDQQDYFAVLAANGLIQVGNGISYQLAYSAHYNAQRFYPDPVGDLIYEGVSSRVFNSALSNSLEGELFYDAWQGHALAAGFYMGEYGVESDDFSLAFPAPNGVQTSSYPLGFTSNLNKINLLYGVFVQDTWRLTEKLSASYGLRWDGVSGFANGTQFSPRINFTYKARPATTLHAGFARYFQVPNFQGIAPETYQTFAGTTAAVGSPGATFPKPERDYYWDVGLIRRLSNTLTVTQDNYFRLDHDYLDEGNFGFVPIDAPFNYRHGYGWGVENSASYNLATLALRVSVYIAREEDEGVATGQFNFTPAELAYMNSHYFILDHTPLVGTSGGAAYRWRQYLFTVDTLYSSGLRGGFANTNGLPDVWQVDLSAARDLWVPILGKINDRIILLNIFDRTNLIRPPTGIGVFQSAYGPRITVYDALTIPLPSF
ncbi:MAG TPA: TonB-dependent receptor [Candidatus Binataceae bacterium]|nr:TonB-dependent receptor [Candidatus Binataceae bacterium]